MATRQKVLVLYLANSALDAPTVAWADYDVRGEEFDLAYLKYEFFFEKIVETAQ